MNESANRARAALLQALAEIAPDADATALKGDEPLRDTLALDSMDFLRLVTRLAELLGVDVPESDYSRTATLDSAVGYLAMRLDAPRVASHVLASPATPAEP